MVVKGPESHDVLLLASDSTEAIRAFFDAGEDCVDPSSCMGTQRPFRTKMHGGATAHTRGSAQAPL